MSFDSDYIWILWANTLLHELGVPVPLTPVALVSGATAMMKGASLLPLLTVVVLGALAGNAAWYYAGRRYGSGVLRLVCKLSLSPGGCMTRTTAAFNRWGGSSLVLGRFMPGVSLVAPPLAGALGMSPSKFMALNAAGAALWALVVVGAGMLFANEIDDVLRQLKSLV